MTKILTIEDAQQRIIDLDVEIVEIENQLATLDGLIESCGEDEPMKRRMYINSKARLSIAKEDAMYELVGIQKALDRRDYDLQLGAPLNPITNPEATWSQPGRVSSPAHQAAQALKNDQCRRIAEELPFSHMDAPGPEFEDGPDFEGWEERSGVTVDKKVTAGKPDITVVKTQFARAIEALYWASWYGITKYDNPGGMNYQNDGAEAAPRYNAAGARHDLKYLVGELYASDAHVHHIISKAWNAMAELELMLIGGLEPIDPAWKDTYMEDWLRQAEEIKRKSEKQNS